MKSNLWLILTLYIFTACIHNPHTSKPNYLKPNSEYIYYDGRVKIDSTQAILYWQGSSANLKFKGDTFAFSIKLLSGKNDKIKLIINDSIIKDFNLKAQDKRLKINLKFDKDTTYKIKIFKTSEYSTATFALLDFSTNGYFLKPDTPKYFIEFYGNSITVGFANLDTSGKIPENPKLTDNYYSYATILTNKLNTAYSNISKSGIGIAKSWVDITMPQLFYRLDPYDPKSKWNFNKQPNIVVINLMQNDYWLLKDTIPQIKQNYLKFLDTLRTLYPNSYIICTLGPMSIVKQQKWRKFLINIIKQTKDPKILYFFFTPLNKRGHPKIKDHQKMANELIQFINKNNLLTSKNSK